MEEDEDIIDEMDARLDAHRMILALLVSQLPDRTSALSALALLERQARKSNLHTATIQEIGEIRDMLDDL